MKAAHKEDTRHQSRLKSVAVQKHRLKLLLVFQAKSGCAHTQPESQRRWRRLLPYLTGDERSRLQIARSHHRIGETRRELDQVCGEIRKEWTGETT